MFSRGRPAARHRVALLATVLTTAGTALVALPVAPAEASISTLCSGYTSCAAKGMGNAGYASANRTSYWRMFSGHNCTNYAAYRMVKAGLGSARPWTGSGNATNWGVKESRITNGVPRVGAVAWWKAGVKPAGSAGHVAYVERVISANEVVLSQDSWHGDFLDPDHSHRRRLAERIVTSATSRCGPPLVPGITGFAKVGSALRARRRGGARERPRSPTSGCRTVRRSPVPPARRTSPAKPSWARP